MGYDVCVTCHMSHVTFDTYYALGAFKTRLDKKREVCANSDKIRMASKIFCWHTRIEHGERYWNFERITITRLKVDVYFQRSGVRNSSLVLRWTTWSARVPCMSWLIVRTETELCELWGWQRRLKISFVDFGRIQGYSFRRRPGRYWRETVSQTQCSSKICLSEPSGQCNRVVMGQKFPTPGQSMRQSNVNWEFWLRRIFCFWSVLLLAVCI